METRSEEHTSELQSLRHLVCRLLLEKKKKQSYISCTPEPTWLSPLTSLSSRRSDPPTRHAATWSAHGYKIGAWCIKFIFFFNDRAPTEIYPFSLPDALPICRRIGVAPRRPAGRRPRAHRPARGRGSADRKSTRLDSSHLGTSYAVFFLK